MVAPPSDPPSFSRRATWDLRDNRLASSVRAVRARGGTLLDLTESNPTRAGIVDLAPLVARLGHSRGVSYAPEALGARPARVAVARYYDDRGLVANPDELVLSASTSEAYAWLFKLLADPGDEVLIPRPSYPLFAFLAQLEEVQLTPYRLAPEEHFRPDLAEIERRIGPRTKAIVVVHPNNPTGTFTLRQDAEALDAIAERHGLALVVDEVFGDYAHGVLPTDKLPSFAGSRRALTFVMSGLSKVLASPQLKLSWTLVLGPSEVRAEAMRRLEVIADTYLSVATPVQLALAELLAEQPGVRDAVLRRIARNLAALDGRLAAVEASGIRRLAVEGGWSAILEVPRTRDDEAWAESLVLEEGVLVHPGFFFDMESEGLLVVSLLTKPTVFAEGIERALGYVSRG